jgi:hypothetical protein
MNMSTLASKLSVIIPLATLLAIIALWQSSLPRFLLMAFLLLFSLVRAFAGVLAKHRKAYLQKKITMAALVRNTLLEIAALVFVMILAGWLGRAIAKIATYQISDAFLKLIAGLMIGLLVGVGVGVLLSKLSSRFVKLSP